MLLGKVLYRKQCRNNISSLSRGSPMVIGVKCAAELAANHIPVMFSKGNYLRRFLYLLEIK